MASFLSVSKVKPKNDSLMGSGWYLACNVVNETNEIRDSIGWNCRRPANKTISITSEFDQGENRGLILQWLTRGTFNKLEKEIRSIRKILKAFQVGRVCRSWLPSAERKHKLKLLFKSQTWTQKSFRIYLLRWGRYHGFCKMICILSVFGK